MNAVEVRLATAVDSADILRWRNDPVTRTMSGSADEVPRAQHDRWYARVLDDPTRHLLVGMIIDRPDRTIGMVRFDLMQPNIDGVAPSHDCGRCLAGDRQAYEVSINLAPEVRRRGLAIPLLTAAAVWLGRRRDAMVVAHTRVDNKAAQRLLDRAAYREMHRGDGWVHYTKPLGVADLPA